MCSPTYSGGTLYVPYQVFDSQPCGVTPSYNQTKQTYVLLSRTRQMIFDLAAGTVSDESGSVSTANVLYRGGILYLPLHVLLPHISASRPRCWNPQAAIRSCALPMAAEVYDDSLFVEKAENLIAYRVRRARAAHSPRKSPPTAPTTARRGRRSSPQPRKSPRLSILLSPGSETMRDSMAALETYNLHGTFFLSEAEIRSDPSLIFELLAAGHAPGCYRRGG